MGELFEKVILKTVQIHVEENNLLMCVWLSCTSQHNASLHEDYLPREPKIQ